jgi:hypothetical protein
MPQIHPEEFGRYSILIDERWTLEDLYVFPRTYEQVYFALDAISPTSNAASEGRVNRAFTAFPWRGGYSAVGFYNQLKWATPPRKRPTIERLRHSSPGSIDLIVNLPQVVQVAVTVNVVAGSLFLCNKVYGAIYSGFQNRKLLRMEVCKRELELPNEELEFVLNSANQMAKLMGFSDATAILQRAPKPLIALKLLLSLYRRVRTLAEYKRRGKVTLPIPGKDDL